MKKLYTRRSISLLFAVCWASYFCTYLGRLNYGLHRRDEHGGPYLQTRAWSDIQRIFCVLRAGPILQGLLADRFCAKRLVGLGLLGSAVLNWGWRCVTCRI